ncbi:MAG: alpha/beta fold hydrolase [Pirellulales bacterium]
MRSSLDTRAAHVPRGTLLLAVILAALASSVPQTTWAQEQKVRAAPHMPAPKFVQTNGIRMAVYEQGEGVPVVLCHGFPELAFSWRHQVKALSEAGFRAIAPDQRGYGLSDRPEDVKSYDLKHLCDDMAGMLDALGIEKAVFCGHDWGGGVVWAMARIHPDRCLGVIGVNTPCSRPPGLASKTPPEPPLVVMSPNYYVMQFQQPGRAEAALGKDVHKTFKMILSRGDIWNVERFKALPADSPERQLNLLAMLERDSFPGTTFLPDDVMDYFVETFQITGFTGGLNWYRNMAGAAASMAGAKWTIDVPCLYVGAEHDVILRPSSANGMEDFISDFERHTIKDCGHWTQQEKPDELNKIIIEWLARKFGGTAKPQG